MKYRIHINHDISLNLFQKAYHCIVARLEIEDTQLGIVYDYDDYSFTVRTPLVESMVRAELVDLYVIVKIERID